MKLKMRTMSWLFQGKVAGTVMKYIIPEEIGSLLVPA
jgi:hypothetical protein